MSVSLHRGETALKAFKLSDVPLDIRIAAAKRLSRTHKTFSPDAKGTDRLLAAVLDVRAHDQTDEKDAIRAAAEHPSDRVYYVSMRKWVEVMGT